MSFLSYSRLTSQEFMGLSTFQFLAFFRRALFYTFLSIYLMLLGLNTTQVTLMATVGMIGNTGAQMFLWGRLLDKYKDSTGFVIIGEATAGIGHFFLYYAHVYELHRNPVLSGFIIIFGLGIIEVFWSMSNVGWSALLSELTDLNERTVLMGQLSIIGGLGGIFGATVGGIIFQAGQGFANGMLFYLPAVIMILSAFIVYITIKADKSYHELLRKNHGSLEVPITTPDIEETQDKTIQVMPSLKDLPRNIVKAYVLFIFALIFVNFGRNSIAIITSLYLYEKTGIAATDNQVAFYRNISGAATMLVGVFIGTISKRISDHKIMSLGTLSAFTGIFVLILSNNIIIAYYAAIFIGASQVLIQASSYSIVAKIIPEGYRGRLFAYYNATFFLSWGIGGTFITGPVADFLIHLGYSKPLAYKASFLIAMLLVFVGFILLLPVYGIINKIHQS